jgi:hypothetical protein
MSDIQIENCTEESSSDDNNDELESKSKIKY